MSLEVVVSTVEHSQPTELVDISSTGARLRGRALPPEGEYVELRMDCIRAFGPVVWSTCDECGVAFDSPLLAVEADRLRREGKPAILMRLPLEERVAMEQWASGVAR